MVKKNLNSLVRSTKRNQYKEPGLAWHIRLSDLNMVNLGMRNLLFNAISFTERVVL